MAAHREPVLRTVVLIVCDLCMSGAGGECHVPGCAFWMKSAPNAPLEETVVPGLPKALPQSIFYFEDGSKGDL